MESKGIILISFIIFIIFTALLLCTRQEPYIDIDLEEVYANIWNYTSNGSIFNYLSSDIYYNFTYLNCSLIKNINCYQKNQTGGGTYLEIIYPGIYYLDAKISGEGSVAGGIYGISIAKNFNPNLNRNCYSRIEGTTTVDTMSVSCLLRLSAGDRINIMIDDEAIPTKPIIIYQASLSVNLIAN